MLTLAILLTGMLHSAAPTAQTLNSVCLHEPASETPDQASRKKSALGLARTINSAEAAYRATFSTYGPLEDLVHGNFVKPAPATGEYVTGFKLRLDLTNQGYWFSLADTTDPCGFRFISNQDGLIFMAEPIR